MFLLNDLLNVKKLGNHDYKIAYELIVIVKCDFDCGFHYDYLVWQIYQSKVFMMYLIESICLFRFATGIEFREGSLLVDQKHNQVIKKGKNFLIHQIYFIS